MTAPDPSLVCTGCGFVAAADQPLPFRCPIAGRDGRDHVLARPGPPPDAAVPADGDVQPFVRYRALSHAWAVARRRGLSDDAFVALVRDLDAAVAAVAGEGRGLTITPYRAAPALGAALGLTGDRAGLWIKDETGNVAGSHKARHLFGLAIYLAVAERTGLIDAATAARPLAIASCGNAA
ncbi:MAG: hypothetical protein KC464_04335, partial [Myxococcales bacterium]|nr:hypothetical protein [Myxococcales bacterium]